MSAAPTWQRLGLHQLPHVLHPQANAKARQAQQQGQSLPPAGVLSGQQQAPRDAGGDAGAWCRRAGSREGR